MTDALIGYTGFVGTTLLRQRSFDNLYRSTNIGEIAGKRFETIVCAGAPAQKWIANREPEADRAAIGALISRLELVRCSRFVLVSTVDVYKSPIGVTEETPVDEEGLHAYGTHRRWLERFVMDRFPDHLVIRLAGLVGPGLRKNVIYDFLHDNQVNTIDSRGVFQFYPMVNLWFDIRIAQDAGLKLLHLTAEPVSVAEVAADGFGKPFEQHVVATPARYDMQSRHAALFGGSGNYQYSKRDTIHAIRSYAQSEPLKH
jgi:hypothetical protein